MGPALLKGWSWLRKLFTWAQDIAMKERDHRESSFVKGRDILKERLARATTDEDRAQIEADLRNLEDDELAYHRSQAGKLGKEIVEKRALHGPVSRDMPALPAPMQKALEQAAQSWASADETPTARSHFLRGNAYFEAGELEKALEEYDASIVIGHDHHDALYNRGTVLTELKRYDEALADFNRALELSPNDPDTLNNRGTVLTELKRYDEALADFNRALELSPDHSNALYNRGTVLTDLKRYDEALADFNLALELCPDDPSNFYNRGNVLTDLKRYDEALTDYSRALNCAQTTRGVFTTRHAYSHFRPMQSLLSQRWNGPSSLIPITVWTPKMTPISTGFEETHCSPT